MPGYELIGDAEQAALNDVFETGGVLSRYGFEDQREEFRVEEFEAALAERMGVEHALMVSSGTAALKLALVGLGIEDGDEVITQSYTFVATLEAALELGATPVVTEIDETLNMDPTDLEEKVTEDTAAIVPVHMGGVPARMDAVLDVAAKYDVPVLEDSAQSMGARYEGAPLGTVGDVGIYSFDPGKIITTGEGGALVTDDESIYQRAREYQNHGHEFNPELPMGADTRRMWGFNYKVTEMHGAVGLAQFEKLDRILETQGRTRDQLRSELADVPGMSLRSVPDGGQASGTTVTVLLESKDRAQGLVEHLSDRDVSTGILPNALKWHFAGTWDHVFSDRSGALQDRWPASRDILERAVLFPISMEMTSADVESIAAECESYLGG